MIIIATFLISYFYRGTPLQKGTWIWETSTIVTHREEIIAFSKQNDVTNIYLYIDRQKVSPKEYALFIKEAANNEIKVEALGGDPTWGYNNRREQIQEFMEWVESYNINVNDNERFSGIHLDIEPYLLPEWKNDRERLMEEWLSNLEFVSHHAKLFNQIEVSVDLPFWANKIEIPGYADYYLSTWMLKRFNTLVLMDYRDYAEGEDGIIVNALDVVKEASAVGKSVIVGVEMAKSNEGDQISFYEEGHRVMEKELKITRDQLKKHAGFRGVAIHGFPEWSSSDQKQNPEPKRP